jgi:hypothetical protein
MTNITTIRLVELAKQTERKLRNHPDHRQTRYRLDNIEAELYRRAARAADELGVIRNWIVNPPLK